MLLYLIIKSNKMRLKNKLILLIILSISFAYSQKVKTKIKQPITASISNIKLLLKEEYIKEKYGNATFDTINLSTQTLIYDDITLDNNQKIKNVTFIFFKNSLFKVVFDYEINIHYGLEAKYGFTELTEFIGFYGSFRNNIKLIKAGNEYKQIIYLKDDKISNLSTSEGF